MLIAVVAVWPYSRRWGYAPTLVAVAVLGMGIYLAGMAGDLPWQEDPTRIPITPFAGIEGFSVPTKIPSASPAASTPAP